MHELAQMASTWPGAILAIVIVVVVGWVVVTLIRQIF